MERAARLIARLKLPSGSVTPEDLARAAWPLAVGKTVAAHTRVFSMVRNSLIVEVEDSVWRRQLFVMSGQILRKIEEVLGSPLIGALEFRVGLSKRPPQRAEQPRPSADEADRIEDPILRRIYIAKRKRETA
jgi:predicted nucleic acid-binding Zn ribbon protein